MYKPIPAEMSEWVSYNSETGELTRKSTNTVITTKNSAGYIVFTGKDRKLYQAGRVAWFLHTGEDPGEMMVDHINRQKDDNRFENLRLFTRQQNRANSCTLGFSKSKQHCNRNAPYRMQLKINGKRVVSKYYSCPLLARLGYIDAISEHHGIDVPITACFPD